jgi:hypothetical protein
MPSGIYKHVHFRQTDQRSFPVGPGEAACVDYYPPKYWFSGGQCCAKNPAKEEAMLVNPPMPHWKYWKTLSGERLWDVKCL